MQLPYDDAMAIIFIIDVSYSEGLLDSTKISKVMKYIEVTYPAIKEIYPYLPWPSKIVPLF